MSIGSVVREKFSGLFADIEVTKGQQMAAIAAVTAGIIYSRPEEIGSVLFGAKQLYWTCLPSFLTLKDKTLPGAWANESSLPRLPVPTLKSSMEYFLNSVKPLLSDAEYQETKAAGEAFINDAKWPQAQLQYLALKETNWTENLWLYGAYLSCKSPLPITSSWYGIDSVERRCFQQGADPQMVRGASIITQTLNYRDRLARGDVDDVSKVTKKLRDIDGKVTGEKTVNISIHQFQYSFGSYQVPSKEGEADYIRVTPNSKHIIVLTKGREYKLEVYRGDGSRVSEAEIHANLIKIKKHAQENQNDGPGVGSFSALKRDKWAEIREKLLISNQEGMEIRETALFALALDDDAYPDVNSMAKAAYFGRRDREFDMNTFIIGLDGTHQAIMAHAKCDATTEASMLKWVLQQEKSLLKNGLMPTPAEEQTAYKAEYIPFDFTKVAAERATVFNEAYIDAKKIDLHVEEVTEVTARELKELGVSPDSFIQLAIMAANRERYGKDVMLYESASTKAFARGRTETCRSFTPEAKAWLDNKDPQKEKDLFLAALRSHQDVIRKAASGRGCDRHLFLGLRYLMQNHPFYKSPGALLAFIATSSQTPSSECQGGGFGPNPDVEEGVGISYDPGIRKDGLNFHISTNKKEGWQTSSQYGQSLREHLIKHRDLLKS